jgi:hypothetical protein
VKGSMKKTPKLNLNRVDYEPTEDVGSVAMDALGNKWKYVGVILGKPVRIKGEIIKMIVYRWLPDPMKVWLPVHEGKTAVK